MFKLYWSKVCLILYGVIHVNSQVLHSSLEHNMSGRVLLELHNRRGVVCYDTFTHRDAAVVCAGIQGAVRSGVVSSVPVNGTWVWLRELGCTGTERMVHDCTLRGWQPSNCTSGLAAAVRCRTLAQGLPPTSSPKPTTSSPYFGVSLEDTSRAGSRGRVVVRWYGDRGAICADGFDEQDAQVVCRMLGLSAEQAVVKYYQRSDKAFFMSDIRCKGHESTLLQCGIGRWAPNNCTRPLQDVGVSCGQDTPSIPSVPCGMRVTLQKIRGGTVALPGSWPWMVSLQNLQDNDNTTFCGASVVAPQWILTAGHCAAAVAHRQSAITAVIGTHNLSQAGVRLGLKKIVIHPNYRDANLQNDVALLQLSQPLNYSRTIRPVCLNSDSSGSPPSQCYAAGWGVTRFDGISQRLLRSASIPIVLHSGCSYVPIYNSSIMLCAGTPRGARDVCVGDSGGPLMCERPGTRVFDLWGIVTGGEPCGTFTSTYSVYTDVSKQLSWINSVIS